MNRTSRWTPRGALLLITFTIACAVLLSMLFQGTLRFNSSSGDVPPEPMANIGPAQKPVGSSPLLAETGGLTNTGGLAPGADQPGFGAAQVAELRQRLQREELAAGPFLLSGGDLRMLTIVVTPSAELLPDSARAIAAQHAIYTAAHHLAQIGLPNEPANDLRAVTFVFHDRSGATVGAVDVDTAEMNRWYTNNSSNREFRCTWSGTPELIGCPEWVKN